MEKRLVTYRLVIEVPRELALMAPQDLELYVRAHWEEWQDKWRQINGKRVSGQVFEVSAGEPMYLMEGSGKCYLVTEGTKVVFPAAA
jgi:hypothetical protein